MRLFLPAACLAVSLLSGCQTGITCNRAPLLPVKVAPLPATPGVALSRQQLWLDGDMSAAAPLPLAVIRADSDRVTLSWHGDALELLSALARARGLVFSYAGVRLPLPVDIDVQGVTYANLLRILEMQTAWRATLTQYPGQMVVAFMPSVPERRGVRR
ncbi:DotD/TraH family lipoprotein [Rahnella sp. BCC 1045]|uniref:DotD/TraH family lipoprotein n=1 Tax=Rahnella sp. BCC 1045 TaxID=2816251 RepID=UPI001C255407|nr:DotD/TraH family lipoprotein [Rahnella sp. BCC 1045]MBU9819674.1 DotD/TraH family lipoprotein [Rahnella sp. BCC 1045]